MAIPVIQGVIDRRVLVNYRISPSALDPLLPRPFRPKLIHGHAVGGVCLIRLTQMRPRFLPTPLGIQSENAAHRIAVLWEHDGCTREGVYIPRRDSSSRLNQLLGGRVFPGVHHHAHFNVNEDGGTYDIRIASDDGVTALTVRAHATDALPPQSVFKDLAEASAFFECGSLGYSPSYDPKILEGLELRPYEWSIRPLHVLEVTSSFFEDRTRFPEGSVTFDSALVMTRIGHEWHSRRPIDISLA